MKILLLLNRLPFPAHDGGALAMQATIFQLLDQGHELYVFALNTDKHLLAEEHYPSYFQRIKLLFACNIRTRVTPFGAIANLLFSRQSYNISRFFEREIKKALLMFIDKVKPEVIHLEGLQIAVYLPSILKHHKLPVVYRAHNVESQIWQRLAQQAPMAKRWYLRNLAHRQLKFETYVLQNVHGWVPISDVDSKALSNIAQQTKPSLTLPYPIHTSLYQFKPFKQPAEPQFFHLASMDWLPNQEALERLLSHIWPQVVAQYPQAHLHIGGRNMPAELQQAMAKQHNVHYYPEVQDAPQWMHAHGIMLVPLLSGGGIRIKVLEAFALGVPVISSPVGVEGIDATPFAQYLPADTNQEFIDRMLSVCQQHYNLSEISQQANTWVLQHHDYHTLATQLSGFYQQLVVV